jgi:hypothetical protein
MKKTLALVGIVKNESKYMLEWIAHYRSIGITEIIVYDNETNDDEAALLRGLADAEIITLIPWSVADGISPQMSAYADALKRFQREFEFLAFFDADEFLVPSVGFDVCQWLSTLPGDVGAVAVNQRVFGSSGHKAASNELVTTRFAQAAEETYGENQWVKSIYRISCVKQLQNPHRGILTSGRYILPCGRDAFEPEDFSGQAQTIDFSLMRLHHYIIKSLEEFLAKRARGGGAGATQQQRMSRYQDLNFFHGRDAMINKAVDSSLADRKAILEIEIDRLKRAIADSSPAPEHFD